jgi:hypothetical protein
MKDSVRSMTRVKLREGRKGKETNKRKNKFLK